MKKIIIILIAATSVFISCEKTLEDRPQGVLNNLKSKADLEAAVVGIYSAFNQGNDNFQLSSFFPMAEVGSRYSTFGSDGDGNGNSPFYKYTYTANSTELNRTWSTLYKAIGRSNEVIDILKTSKDSTFTMPLIAEARFLRAWSYFVLTQFWGEVPLHLKAINSTTNVDEIYKSKATVPEVYEQIIADLNYACGLDRPIVANKILPRLPLLRQAGTPVIPIDQGRVRAGSAYALLGKVYLTMAGKPLNAGQNAYTNAANIFKILIDNKTILGIALVPIASVGANSTYPTIFATNNEWNTEILFGLRSFANANILQNGSSFPTNLSPKFSGVDANLSNGETPNYGLRYDILNLFDGRDVRTKDGIGGTFPDRRSSAVVGVTRDSLKYSLTEFKYKRKNNPTPTSDVQGPAGSPTRYGLGYTKWRADLNRAGGSTRGYNNDWIIIRYADVLLSYAEALNESGKTTTEVLVPLNEVRARANAATLSSTQTQISLRDIIRKERTRELVGEFTTVFDIRRWGTLEDEINAYQPFQILNGTKPLYDSKFYLYPIPSEQLSLNPKLYPQNPGW